jgi:CPA1 family monovalent cation:H+ antiporter
MMIGSKGSVIVDGIELVLVLLTAITLIAAVAERTSIPYPIFLVLGGAALGLIPGVPSVELDPDLVFLLFLPPVLFAAAYFTSWRDFRGNLRPIGLLAIGCVLATTLAVAVVGHLVIDGLDWPAAFVLGAIVAPPDAAAATAIFQRLGVPRRVVTILEGESLVNDASALVAYRFAVAAVVTGSFSAWSAGGRFFLMAGGGIVIGYLAGRLISIIVPWIGSPSLGTMASLLSPAAIYILAEKVEVSGVLAVVVAGLVFGRSSSTTLEPSGRISALAVWEFAIFLCNGLVFILIGLQLRSVAEGITGRSTAEIVVASLAISATVILVRVIWVYPATYLPRAIPKIRISDPSPPWQMPAIISWAGLRGIVSLASALALPLETDAGTPFPDRDLIVFLTFTVILATLVGQGLTLEPVVKLLRVSADNGIEREETLARRKMAQAALNRLESLSGEPWISQMLATKMRFHYEHQLEHLPASYDPQDLDGDHIADHGRLRREVVHAQRLAIIELRNRNVIGDEALHRIERDLDLEELRSDL